MEREADAPHSLVAVVTGGINLVGLSVRPDLAVQHRQTRGRDTADPRTEPRAGRGDAQALECSASANGMDRLLSLGAGDRYLIPRLCADSSELVSLHRLHRVTSAIADRAGAGARRPRTRPPPVRAAIRMIEEDPDTVLDVLHLLDHGSLPRSRSRQMPTRTGTDRLQLSGAVVLVGWVLRLYERGVPRGVGRALHHRPGRAHVADCRAGGARRSPISRRSGRASRVRSCSKPSSRSIYAS